MSCEAATFDRGRQIGAAQEFRRPGKRRFNAPYLFLDAQRSEPDELAAALAPALQDTVNVTVLFHPGRLAIFTDHDEYTTVFSPLPLGQLKERLTERRVRLVDCHRTAAP